MAKNTAEVVEQDDAEAEVKKAPATKLARGRMPTPVVYCIKFNEGDENDSAVAAKYFTTAGKVADIRQGRNFGYISEDTRFTKAQIEEAKERIEKSFASEKSDTKPEDAAYTLEQLDKLEPGSEDDAKKLEEARASARKPRGEKKEAVEPSGDKVVEEAELEESSDEDLDALMADM